MKYLSEILAFENWIEYNSQINKSDIRLWYTLMYFSNRFEWKEFAVPISKLISKSKLNKDAIYRSRNKLKQFRIVEFKERSGNQCAIYKMKSVVALYGLKNATQNATESATQNANINKTRDQRPEKESTTNVVPKKKFGEFENVLLTDEELDKLYIRLGDSKTQDYIESISSYCKMHKKKYDDYYAAILNWARRDKEKKGESKHGTDESEVGRRAQCTEFLDVESTDGSELSSEEIARIRAENEEFAKLGV